MLRRSRFIAVPHALLDALGDHDLWFAAYGVLDCLGLYLVVAFRVILALVCWLSPVIVWSVVMLATRQWRRDGSENVMPITSAAHNLRRNATDLETRKQTVDTIKGRLRSGERIETEHAVFYVPR